MQRNVVARVLLYLPVLALAVLMLGGTAGAQSTTASIHGVVSDDQGPLAGATVVAVNSQTGFRYEAVAGADGAYKLGGLAPGNYEIKVASQAYKEQVQTVQVLIGQTSTVDFRLTLDAVFVENVTVVGDATKLLIDDRSPEISTNITPQQMEDLPMNNRNFLSYAALAPGVSFTADTDAAGQSFRSGGSNPNQVNVFIDGLSYKNDIIQGGAFMQDSSRGNPFPQNAVQEYQVLTQNYKAEYEKAAAAVITAITKSGGNDLHGDAFYLYQDKGMVEQDEFAKARGDEKAPYERNQYGLSVGGPIIKDKLHFFISYEGNQRDVVSSVFHGSSWGQEPANVTAILEPYPTGTLSAPLDSQLYFGKLSWQPSMSQTAELSYHRRDEEEIRGFGGQRVVEGASDFQVYTDALVVRHQAVFGNSINEASLNWQQQQWKDTAVNASVPHMNYINLLDVGSKDYIQDLSQEKMGLRDDFTFYFDWLGTHTMKAGVVANWMDYKLQKSAYFIPYYEFRQNEEWQFPFLARYGFGDPALDFSNEQYGLYAQDDWQVAPNVTVSAGVRWDYETNMLNNDWETPADIAEGLRTACRTYSQPVGGQTEWCINELFDVENYISDGSNRSSYSNMFQPRVGFTWDVKGDAETVVFGGWGLYYDRVTLNDIYDEQYRQSWKQYTFCFTDNPAWVGTTNNVQGCGAPAVLWNPSYLDADGLSGLIASGQTPGPEVFLLANDTKPPRSIQWTVGLRQRLGKNWLGSLTYASSEGENSMAWSFGTLPPGTAFNDRWGNWIPIPGYAFIMRNYDMRRTEYDGVFLTLDKPYTTESKWGFNFAYTYAKGYQNASLDEGAAFAFDYIPPEWPMFPSNGDERQRFVFSGTVGLPLGFRVSSIITLGTGTPITYTDCLAGWDKCVWYPNGARPDQQSFLGIEEFAYRSVDLRAEWEAPQIADRLRIGLIAEAFNVLNYDNYSGFDGWAGAPGEPNPNFLKPNSQYNTRRFQVGLRLGF
jgi:outer membrane receptor for ferrienterochelin and colicin